MVSGIYVYVPVGTLFSISIFVIVLLFVVSYFLGSSTTSADFEKLSVYECGFAPFLDTQGTFDVRFYLVAMLFLVFDLEIMFLLPWASSFFITTFTSVIIFVWFTGVLTIAFVYEWLKGALEWQ